MKTTLPPDHTNKELECVSCHRRTTEIEAESRNWRTGFCGDCGYGLEPVAAKATGSQGNTTMLPEEPQTSQQATPDRLGEQSELDIANLDVFKAASNYATREGITPETLRRFQVNWERQILALIEQKVAEAEEAANKAIGTADIPDWDEESGFCNTCDFQPTDDTRNCICVFRNQLRTETRAAFKEFKDAS